MRCQSAPDGTTFALLSNRSSFRNRSGRVAMKDEQVAELLYRSGSKGRSPYR
jgi:hypothetical protein